LGAIVGGEHSTHGSGAYDADKCDLKLIVTEALIWRLLPLIWYLC